METNVHASILDEITRNKPGMILFPSDFQQLGTVSAVNMALSRLAKQQKLIRVAQGIYYIPKKDPKLGAITPSLEQIAAALAEKEHVRIRPTGVTALNLLGLSTQVPMRVQFLTDGNSRSIKVGKRAVTFTKTTPKRLSVQSPTTFLVIQALETLGKEVATNQQLFQKLTQLLQKEDPTTLRKDAKLAPAWIGQILYAIAQKLNPIQNEMVTTS